MQQTQTRTLSICGPFEMEVCKKTVKVASAASLLLCGPNFRNSAFHFEEEPVGGTSRHATRLRHKPSSSNHSKTDSHVHQRSSNRRGRSVTRRSRNRSKSPSRRRKPRSKAKSSSRPAPSPADSDQLSAVHLGLISTLMQRATTPPAAEKKSAQEVEDITTSGCSIDRLPATTLKEGESGSVSAVLSTFKEEECLSIPSETVQGRNVSTSATATFASGSTVSTINDPLSDVTGVASGNPSTGNLRLRGGAEPTTSSDKEPVTLKEMLHKYKDLNREGDKIQIGPLQVKIVQEIVAGEELPVGVGYTPERLDMEKKLILQLEQARNVLKKTNNQSLAAIDTRIIAIEKHVVRRIAYGHLCRTSDVAERIFELHVNTMELMEALMEAIEKVDEHSEERSAMKHQLTLKELREEAQGHLWKNSFEEVKAQHSSEWRTSSCISHSGRADWIRFTPTSIFESDKKKIFVPERVKLAGLKEGSFKQLVEEQIPKLKIPFTENDELIGISFHQKDSPSSFVVEQLEVKNHEGVTAKLEPFLVITDSDRRLIPHRKVTISACRSFTVLFRVIEMEGGEASSLEVYVDPLPTLAHEDWID